MLDSRFEQLRRRILEAEATSSAELFEKLSPAELLHELSVYHAELLAQYEDLETANAEADQRAVENHALFRAAPLAFFVITAQAEIEQANELGEELMRSRGVRIGGKFTKLFPHELSDLKLWLTQGQGPSPKIIQSDRTTWYQLHRENFSDDRLLITLTDTSEIVESRARYRDALAQLKGEQAKLMQSLAIVAHELRTPLASLNVMLEEQKVADLEPYGEAISSSAEHLQHVLDDLQMILSPDQDSHSSHRVESPYALAERVVTSLRFLFTEQLVRVTLNGDERSSEKYQLPAQAIRQILTNLLKNAALHSRGTEVRVNLSVTELDEASYRLTIQVVDNGEGIPEAAREQIFEAYGRSETSADGMGLGLYVSQRLAKEHSGRLALQSEVGVGSRFVLELPIHSAPNSDIENPADKISFTKALAGKHILVVDDDQFQRMLLGKYLEALGASTASADNGDTALALIQDGTFDALVSDLNMPGMDGFGLLRALRDQGESIATIIVTGGIDEATRQRLLKLGALGVLIKPVHAHQIAKLIRGDQVTS